MNLLATFATTLSQTKQFNLLFQWADGGNLETLWQDHPEPRTEHDQEWTMWLAEQCLGLVDGLSGIHDTRLTLENLTPVEPSSREERVCGRHGDIKPPNILWFSHEQRPGTKLRHGVLKISDFGLTTFESITQTKVPPTGVPFSPIYMAPEYETGNNRQISRPYDIWSLGCVFLEFITWILTGQEGLARFAKTREDEKDDMSRFVKASFCNLYRDPNNREPSYTEAAVKTAVETVCT